MHRSALRREGGEQERGQKGGDTSSPRPHRRPKACNRRRSEKRRRRPPLPVQYTPCQGRVGGKAPTRPATAPCPAGGRELRPPPRRVGEREPLAIGGRGTHELPPPPGKRCQVLRLQTVAGGGDDGREGRRDRGGEGGGGGGDVRAPPDRPRHACHAWGRLGGTRPGGVVAMPSDTGSVLRGDPGGTVKRRTVWEGGGQHGGRGGGEDDAAGVTAPAEPRARGGGGDGVVAERAGTPQPQRAPPSPLAWIPTRPTVSAQVR